jgi:bacterioferritin
LKLEHIAHADLIATIECCETEKDFISRDLAKDILEAEEEHVDWLETQLSLIDRVGEQNYLQTAMKTVRPG